MPRSILLGAALGALSLSACATTVEGDPAATVTARAETVRVAGSGDAADDPAIWVAPDPQDTLIIGTDKTAGLYVFGLDGAVRQFLPVGRLNNVDLREGFPTSQGERVLLAATDRTNIALALFTLDPASGEVTPAANGVLPLDVGDPYGACLHRTAEGAFEALVTGNDGEFRHLRIREGAAGMEIEVLRSFWIGSISEGCVFDDRTGDLFVAEEEVGIWRYDADPATGEARTLLHSIDDAALVADVEGLSVYPEGEDGGWLVASSQGDSAYTLFALPEGRYVGRVRVMDGDAVDGTTETDGLDVTPRPVAGYPDGLLVVQDDADDAGGQNFKLIDWRDVVEALELE